MTSAQLAACLPRPPSSCLFWKRAAALLLIRRALAPFKGNRQSGGSARAWELPPAPEPKAVPLPQS